MKFIVFLYMLIYSIYCFVHRTDLIALDIYARIKSEEEKN